MDLNINQLTTNNWNYYLMLESDFLNITRYISIEECNYSTVSIEIIKLIQSIGAECDMIFKKVSNYSLNERRTMQDYVKILDAYPQILNIEIAVKNTSILLHPFKDWNKQSPGKLSWWKSYNNIKHNREENYKSGNFGNLLNILAALYFLEMYLYKKVGKETNTIDIPPEKSKLFIIKDWKTNPLEKTIFIKKNILSTEKVDIGVFYIVGNNELEVHLNGENLLKTDELNTNFGHYIECGNKGEVSHFIRTTPDWNLEKGDYLHVKISR